MDWRLATAAMLTILTGLAHSILGERFILMRLFRRELPPLLGSDAFTKRTLRFVWHVMTVWAFGLAAIMLMSPTATVLWLLVAMMVATAMLTVVVSRGQHLSWIVELVIAGLLAWAI